MKERITPDQVVRHHAKLCGISVEDIVIAPLLIVSWMKPAVERIARLLDCRPCKHWLYGEACPAYTGSVDSRAVSVGLLRVGAPTTVMMLEEFIACGARTIIGLGYEGSLQPMFSSSATNSGTTGTRHSELLNLTRPWTRRAILLCPL